MIAAIESSRPKRIATDEEGEEEGDRQDSEEPRDEHDDEAERLERQPEELEQQEPWQRHEAHGSEAPVCRSAGGGATASRRAHAANAGAGARASRGSSGASVQRDRVGDELDAVRLLASPHVHVEADDELDVLADGVARVPADLLHERRAGRGRMRPRR